MWDSELYRSGGSTEEGPQLRGGHLGHGLCNVSSVFFTIVFLNHMLFLYGN